MQAARRAGIVLGVPSLCALALWACSGEAEESAPAQEASQAEPAATGGPAPGGTAPAGRAKVAHAPRTGDEPYASAELGALHGTILHVGKVPERFPLGASESAECKNHPGVDQRQNLVVVNDGKLAGAFVRISSGYDEGAVPSVSSAPVTLDQKGCMYVPRVLALRVGQRLLVTNLDPATHNVHTLSKRNAELNLNMGKDQPALEFTFERAERPVTLKCDIHPWMGAAVFVEEHPWFAVSDERGAFVIQDVPPGEYVVEAQHEQLGKASGRVTVQAGSSAGFTLTLGK